MPDYAQLFLNYDPMNGYTIRSYRNNGVYCDPNEFVVEIDNDNECCVDLADIDNAIHKHCTLKEPVELITTISDIIFKFEFEQL